MWHCYQGFSYISINKFLKKIDRLQFASETEMLKLISKFQNIAGFSTFQLTIERNVLKHIFVWQRVHSYTYEHNSVAHRTETTNFHDMD